MDASHEHSVMPSSSALLPSWDQVRRLLVVRLDNIGDVVMTGPAMRAIKAALPDAHLTLMASPAGSQVAPLLPWVDEILTLRAVWQDVSGSLGLDPQRELDLVESLRKEHFDAAVILTSFSQSPYPPAYVAYLAGIPLRLGHSKEFGGFVLSHWFKPPSDDTHQVDRNLALVEAVGFSAEGPDSRRMELRLPLRVRERAATLMREANANLPNCAPQAPYIAMVPGASCQARRYPAERFARLAALLHAYTGWQIVLLGSPKETNLLESFQELLQPPAAPGPRMAQRLAPKTPAPVISLIGETSVPEMAAIIAGASLVVANDSAPMHLADALGTPMLIFFSGTELESQWQPRFAPARLLRQPTPCHPCYRFQCPYQLECLDITPEQAAAAALELIAGGRSVEVQAGSQPGRMVQTTTAASTTTVQNAAAADSGAAFGSDATGRIA